MFQLVQIQRLVLKIFMLIHPLENVLNFVLLFLLYLQAMIQEVVFPSVLPTVLLIIIQEDVFKNVQLFQGKPLQIILPIDAFLNVQPSPIISHQIKLINALCNVLQIQKCMQIIQQELV